MKKAIVAVLKVTGYRFPKFGFLGRDTISRKAVERLIGYSLVELNLAAWK